MEQKTNKPTDQTASTISPNNLTLSPQTSNKSSKIFFLVLSLSLIVSLVTTGFFAYQNFQLKQKLATQSPITPNQTPVPTPTITSTPSQTTDWNTHSDNTLPFSFQTPPEMYYQAVYNSEQPYHGYLSYSPINIPDGPYGGFLTPVQINYLDKVDGRYKTFEEDEKTVKTLFRSNEFNEIQLDNISKKHTLITGIGQEYFDGLNMSVLIIDTPVSPTLVYHFGPTNQDAKFTKDIFNQIISTIKLD